MKTFLAFILLAALSQAQPPDPAAIFDKIYSAPAPPFKTEPSAFLVRAVDAVPAGEALDVAMGQGRNSLFLASKGWRVTGYDVSSVGLAQAGKSAAAQGLTIKTQLASHDTFDFGKNRWDLIVLIFPGTSMEDAFVRKVKDALKPGGMVVVEQFNAPPGEGNKGRANALFGSFQDLRVVRYEDVPDISDWGRMKARIGRLAAVKE